MPVSDRIRSALADRYVLEREIGAGGMATVYLARDVKHDREVAIKVLRADLAAVLGVERFLAEVRITARLDHPHILTLIDSGEADGMLYYVMPFVRGESLRTRLSRDRQLGIQESLSITRQIASALDYAHSQGVVHRDIKPENILLHEGEAVLADFGIAIAVKEAGGNRLTETGLSLGTPMYMSPEQATGDRSLDARSDIYSLAAVLYEMLGGEPPVTGATAQAMIAKLLTERPTSLRVVRDTVTPQMDRAIMRALSKVPADRFESAGQFVRTLDSEGAASTRSTQTLITRWFVAAGVILVLLIGGGVAWHFLRTPLHTPVTLGDQKQVTFSGDAEDGAISDDGRTIAYRVATCTATACTYGIEVQEVGGSTARRVFDGSPRPISGMRWSPDRRIIMFDGGVGDNDNSLALVSLLGGPPTVLRNSSTNADFFGSDSLVTLARQGEDVRFILITGLDGVVRDRIQVADSTEGLLPEDVMWVPDSPWFIVILANPQETSSFARLVDRHGRRVAGWRMNSSLEQEWASADAFWRLEDSDTPDRNVLVRYPFDARNGKLSQQRDTVYAGSAGNFTVTRDGSSILLSEGSKTYTIRALTTSALFSHSAQEDSKVASATSALGAFISPDGQRLLISHHDGASTRLTTRGWARGTESPISVGGVMAAEWADSVTVAYSALHGGHTILGLLDVRTGAVRDTLSVDSLTSNSLFARAASSWIWIASDGRLRIQRRTDSKPRLFPMPATLRTVSWLGATTNGDHVLLVGYKQTRASDQRIAMSGHDSIAYVMTDAEGRTPDTWATTLDAGVVVPGTDSPVAIVSSGRYGGTSTVFRIRSPGKLEPIGSIAPQPSSLTFSSNLERAALGTVEYHGDAFLMHVNRRQ